METTKEKIRVEWSAFCRMTFRQKLEHIWLYYRWALLVLVVVIAVLISAVSSIRYNRREQLISGFFLNTATSDEGYAFLQDGYWEKCGGLKSQRAELIDYRPIDFESDVMTQAEAANLMVLSSMIAAKSLDYVVTTESSLALFTEQEVIQDLSQLPGDFLDSCQTVAENGSPIAIRLDGTYFAEHYPLTAEDSCILVINNTQNPERTADFLKYVLKGE